MNDSVILKAEIFATKAHAGQTEKDELKTPYIEHVKKVANLVSLSGGSPEEIASAWLHDVVEDTPVTILDIERDFGKEIARIVKGLTDLPGFSDLPVAERKQRQADHIATEDSSVRRVKLADQISAVELDSKNDLLTKEHRIQYVKGCRKIADACKGVSPLLDERFNQVYTEALKNLS